METKANKTHQHHSYRNLTLQNWGRKTKIGTKIKPRMDELIVGTLLRIADSMEFMADKLCEVTEDVSKLKKQNKKLYTENMRLRCELRMAGKIKKKSDGNIQGK